jgi:glycine oxidase
MGSPEVAIVGAGVIGCGIALRLAQAGAAVTILERSRPGAEASSAAAGVLGPQLEDEGSGPFFELCLRSREMYPEFVAEIERLSEMDVEYIRCGALRVAFDEAGAAALEASSARQRARGLRAEVLSPADAIDLEPLLSPRTRLAVHLPDDHQLENRRLARALAIAAARAGATFRIASARSVAIRGSAAIGVGLEGGELLGADSVVIAAGCWSSLIEGNGTKPDAVKPMRGQIVQLDAGAPLLRKSIIGDRGFIVQRSDGRMLVGSTYELVGFDKQNTAEGTARILAAGIELCPAIARLPIRDIWAGLRPYTSDHWPIIGPGPVSGLFLATGHLRNGILLAPVTALLIQQAVLGQATAVDLNPFRYDRICAENGSTYK